MQRNWNSTSDAQPITYFCALRIFLMCTAYSMGNFLPQQKNTRVLFHRVNEVIYLQTHRHVHLTFDFHVSEWPSATTLRRHFLPVNIGVCDLTDLIWRCGLESLLGQSFFFFRNINIIINLIISTPQIDCQIVLEAYFYFRHNIKCVLRCDWLTSDVGINLEDRMNTFILLHNHTWLIILSYFSAPDMGSTVKNQIL